MSALNRPIIIVGAPRSGTTILYRLLRAHPDLCDVPEPRIAWRYGNDGKSDLLRPEDARPEVIAYINRWFEAQLEGSGANRIVEKTPSNSIRMGFVNAVFPDACFVHILRDGVDSILSIRASWDNHASGIHSIQRKLWKQRLKEASPRQYIHYAKEVAKRVLAKRGVGGVAGVWGPRLPGIEQMAKEMSSLEIACLQWRWSVEHTIADGRNLPADRYLEVDLEGFDRTSLDRVLAHCELDPSPNVVKEFHETFDNSESAARRKALSPEDRETIDRWAGPTLAWLETRQDRTNS